MAKFIILDTETTGNAEEDRIIQLGFMVLGKPSQPPLVFNEFCTPSLEIKIEAMEVHGITPEMIQGKPVCTQTEAFHVLNTHNTADNFLIMHNAPFDLGMLAKEGFIPQAKVIDTLRCAKHLFPQSKAHRLQYFRYEMGLYKEEAQTAKELGVEVKAHDAIGDVLVLKLFVTKLVQAVKEQFDTADVMGKLVELTNTPVLITTFNFGKHKGRPVAEVVREDAPYIAWMQKNMTLDSDMQYTLSYYMKS